MVRAALGALYRPSTDAPRHWMRRDQRHLALVLRSFAARSFAMNTPDPDAPPPGAPRQASFLQALGAAFSSFLGIRKKAASERDMLTIKPVHVIVAALLAAALFVAALITLVTFITRGR